MLKMINLLIKCIYNKYIHYQFFYFLIIYLIIIVKISKTPNI